MTGPTFSGARVRELRDEAELSRKRLALISRVSERSIGYYESDERVPSGVTIYKLARALGVRVGDFYADTADEDREEAS